ncbi:hypothetical protein [Nitrospirillum sp. BR 11828]|uniref:hypothetical protein n=1 Tax=Nitrospirillum sp. BR 11828 TaxID=3104325 RepID=UPI002AC9FCC1|nr:hypothetical protein [Nitrospirillum sp. BR 11828]MDZ5649311.1 hypothetical protein [Nitrospirillum sp. BR 11828]
MNDLSKHFPLLDLGDGDLAVPGHLFCHVSIFDHWLDEQEADHPLMCYSTALAAGALDEYMLGEQKFLKFYSLLSKGGVICNRPGPLRIFEAMTPELEHIFVDSLREKRFMDVYFKGTGVRVIGRYDRTDLVIADSQEELRSFQLKSHDFGLFELN